MSGVFEELTEKLVKGDRRACGRLLSMTENEEPGYLDFLKRIYKYEVNAYVIGITGPPGSGKSTLAGKLAKTLSKAGKRVGVLAVDPTSPFTKGAILGDRIRMSELSTDENIFIRSMGTRGALGGLSKACAGALTVLAAFGCEYIFIETVGVGQSEIDIVKTADTTLMVLAPGLGDDIQAIKAGVMEIGDVFAVNKADRDGAYKTYRETQAMLDFKQDWDFRPPVCLTTAESGEGVEQLLDSIHSHKDFLTSTGKIHGKRLAKNLALLKDIIRDRLNVRVDAIIAERSGQYSLDESDPYTLSETILSQIKI